MTSPRHFFAAFDVTREVFFKSRLSFGIVNLKPIIPGHVLILPQRVVPRLADLDHEEVSDLFQSAQTVGKALESAYNAQALTISLQDGLAAGQSVPHVHIHILPRHSTDFGGDNDRVYPELERSEEELSSDLHKSEVPLHFSSTRKTNGNNGQLIVPKDEDRKPRSVEEMEEEAKRMKSLFPDQAWVLFQLIVNADE